LETYLEIRSDVLPFEQRPWMKGAQITDAVLEAIASSKQDFIRLNYPNGDMVGHTGIYDAVLVSMGALDLCVARLVKAVEKAGGAMILTADHGNSDDMFEHDKNGNVKHDEKGEIRRKTSHSLNPVPCVIYDPTNEERGNAELAEGLGISSISATCAELLGFVPPETYDPSVFKG
jgi:2,3-bisphosphoglycerate-independent phosphoglycerate mutase